MSNDDYARLFIHAPTRLVIILIACLGGGAGMHHFLAPGPDRSTDQQELFACQRALADTRILSGQYEQDIAELIAWSERTLATIGPIQRMGAFNDAPSVFTFARGSLK